MSTAGAPTLMASWEPATLPADTARQQFQGWGQVDAEAELFERDLPASSRLVCALMALR